ncbi:hypothetical protein OSI78_10825, partial [Mycobacterium ulcerans]
IINPAHKPANQQRRSPGCTTEPAFGNVLPEIANWLGTPAHSDQVILRYLEDELKDARAYASAVGTLDGVLRRPDGSSLIYRPNPAQRAADGCVRLPLNLSRNDVRASGAQVVVVGSCASGWASDVFNWDGVEVEKGSTSGYRAYPACDATYGAGTYASRLVRYYEDSTLVSALVKPTRPPTDPEALAPAKAKAMIDCGVNLFGFDQLLPEDGRIQASLWSWAPDEPRARRRVHLAGPGRTLGVGAVYRRAPRGLRDRGGNMGGDLDGRHVRGCSVGLHRRWGRFCTAPIR